MYTCCLLLQSAWLTGLPLGLTAVDSHQSLTRPAPTGRTFCTSAMQNLAHLEVIATLWDKYNDGKTAE